MWCYPDKESFQKIILDVVGDYDKYKDMSKKLKAHVKKEFEADKQYDAFANAVSPPDEKSDEAVVVNFD